jgi:hypothetical protein
MYFQYNLCSLGLRHLIKQVLPDELCNMLQYPGTQWKVRIRACWSDKRARPRDLELELWLRH